MTTPQTTPELLPCPFCGGEPEIVNFSVHCNNPYCEAQPFTAGQFITEAITKWNTRAASQRVTSAPLEGVRVPPGWKLVPIEPDSNMMNSAPDVWHSWKSRDNGGNIQQLGKMMWERYLDAAPLPPGRGMVPMTEEQIKEIWWNDQKANDIFTFARALEAAHGISHRTLA